ncbi:MAG: major capsid protein [Methylobacillus sp.]|jgi:hypothetical protein|nr:major capsid protein [Methylobacillus sp.]
MKILLSFFADVIAAIGDRLMMYMADTGMLLTMAQMTPSEARQIDPILTTVAQGYQNAALVGMALFGYVPVQQRGGKIITFGKEDFRLYATGRAPGSNTKRVQFGYAGESYALEQKALEGTVPFELMEEAANVPGIDLGSGAVRKVQNIIALELELAQAGLATDASKYANSNKLTLSGTDQWSNDASKPLQVIESAKEAVRAQIARRPNTIVMGAAVFAHLKNHPLIVDRIKYTGRDIATTDLLASLFDVERVLVGDAIYEDKNTTKDVWGKSVVLAYTDIGSLADQGLPTFGYTYRLGGYPIVEQPYQDRNAKSWIYPVTDEVAPVIAGASAGFLISNAVA